MRKIIEKDKTIGWKNSWISVYKGFHKLNFKFGPASYFDNRWHISFSLIYFQFYISFPIKSKYDECDPPRYGFYFYAWDAWWPDTFVICRGKKTIHFDLPWCMRWVRTSKLMKDGKWAHETKYNGRIDWYSPEYKELWSETYPYTYTLKNGTIQNRIAKVGVSEREWRPLWFMWTGLFKKVRRTIDVEFSDEVGERTGTWKGGTVGCGYNMIDPELPIHTLRRMERERKFSR